MAILGKTLGPALLTGLVSVLSLPPFNAEWLAYGCLLAAVSGFSQMRLILKSASEKRVGWD